MRGAGVVAVPSVWPENCPLSVLEAMAYGRPVVGSAVGGIPDLVTDGVEGRLVPHGEPAALRGALSSLMADGAARSAMGARGRQRIRERHAPARHVDDVVALYGEAIESATRRRAA
jgi:glycosyltransferase involved in cell wall biosynthesis